MASQLDAAGVSPEQPAYLHPQLSAPQALPVKNGFIHFEESESEKCDAPSFSDAPPMQSAPGVLLQNMFRTKPGVGCTSDVSDVETIDSTGDSNPYSRSLYVEGKMADDEDDILGLVSNFPHEWLQAELKQDSVPVTKLVTDQLGTAKVRSSLCCVPEAGNEGATSPSNQASRSVAGPIGRMVNRPEPLSTSSIMEAVPEGLARPPQSPVIARPPQSPLGDGAAYIAVGGPTSGLAPPSMPPPGMPPPMPPPQAPGLPRPPQSPQAAAGSVPLPSQGVHLDASPMKVTSIGSAQHAEGKCQPCAWFWKPQGCQNGLSCKRCHLCPLGTLKVQKKAKKDSLAKGSTSQAPGVTSPEEMATVTVKNTFIEWSDNPELPASALHSAPAQMFGLVDTNKDLRQEFRLDTTTEGSAAVRADLPPPSELQRLLHEQGQCKPCAYYWYKKDGCRKEVECQFCHICEKGESKKRKKERVKMLKAANKDGDIPLEGIPQ